jgi:hypothetical protein
VSLLKIQLQIQRNAYPTLPSPKKNGSVKPGRKMIIKIVKTRNTQIMYNLRRMKFKIFKRRAINFCESS